MPLLLGLEGEESEMKEEERCCVARRFELEWPAERVRYLLSLPEPSLYLPEGY